jgi:hypothetical protein
MYHVRASFPLPRSQSRDCCIHGNSCAGRCRGPYLSGSTLVILPTRAALGEHAEPDDDPHKDYPNKSEPDDIDTLWSGGSPDRFHASDGDGLDSLDGGSSIADKCTFDRGDIATSC